MLERKDTGMEGCRKEERRKGGMKEIRDEGMEEFRSRWVPNWRET